MDPPPAPRRKGADINRVVDEQSKGADVRGRGRYRAEVAHDPEMLHVQVITAVGAHHLRPLLCQRRHYVPPQEARRPEHRRRDSANLRTTPA